MEAVRYLEITGRDVQAGRRKKVQYCAKWKRLDDGASDMAPARAGQGANMFTKRASLSDAATNYMAYAERLRAARDSQYNGGI